MIKAKPNRAGMNNSGFDSQHLSYSRWTRAQVQRPSQTDRNPGDVPEASTRLATAIEQTNRECTMTAGTIPNACRNVQLTEFEDRAILRP